MQIVAIDPGTFESAFVVFDSETHAILQHGQDDNRVLLPWLEKQKIFGRQRLVIEMIKSYGMAVGDSTFETCLWIGRFIERWGGQVDKIPRKTVVTLLCGTPRAKDTNVRRRLLDMFGPAMVKGFTRDQWSALAVAVAWDILRDPKKYALSEGVLGGLEARTPAERGLGLDQV